MGSRLSTWLWRKWKRSFVALICIQLLIAMLSCGLFHWTVSYLMQAKFFPYVRGMEVTAYTAGPESTGKHRTHPEFGLTASTHQINVGTGEKCIAAPPEYAYGTRIYIPGYGAAIVKDRGDDIFGDRLDIYYDEVGTAKAWGRQNLLVVIFP